MNLWYFITDSSSQAPLRVCSCSSREVVPAEKGWCLHPSRSTAHLTEELREGRGPAQGHTAQKHMLGQTLRLCLWLYLLPEDFSELAVASGKRPCKEGGPETLREASRGVQGGGPGCWALFLPISLTFPPQVGVTIICHLLHTENSVYTYTKSHLVFSQILCV